MKFVVIVTPSRYEADRGLSYLNTIQSFVLEEGDAPFETKLNFWDLPPKAAFYEFVTTAGRVIGESCDVVQVWTDLGWTPTMRSEVQHWTQRRKRIVIRELATEDPELWARLHAR